MNTRLKGDLKSCLVTGALFALFALAGCSHGTTQQADQAGSVGHPETAVGMPANAPKATNGMPPALAAEMQKAQAAQKH